MLSKADKVDVKSTASSTSLNESRAGGTSVANDDDEVCHTRSALTSAGDMDAVDAEYTRLCLHPFGGTGRARAGDYVVCFWLLGILSFMTHMYNIEVPDHVCWDETHFGKMGSWYINRTFFFDVHPPLGKMLIGFAGQLTGYDGTFAFDKPGDKYRNSSDFVGMRVFCACFGALLVPFAYHIVYILSQSVPAALLAGIIVLCENGTLTLTRYILLDPFLIFFIVGSVFSYVNFMVEYSRPFGVTWWYWLSMTGIFLAFSIGVKFVGFFVILFIGLNTIKELYDLFSDTSNQLMVIFKHFVGRAVCLIALPVVVYMGIFANHLHMLNHSGGGDGMFSAQFQIHLNNNRLNGLDLPEEVAFGSKVSIKQYRTGGAYLHSHWHLYPKEHPPQQQQVTSYGHKDENNIWIIKKSTGQVNVSVDPVEYVKNGDIIRLEHEQTRRNMHSHKEPAALTKTHFQVSCYGENGTGDTNDYFRINIVNGEPGERLKIINHRVQFIHVSTGCTIHCNQRKLPKWGFEQLEVSCTTQLWNPNTEWHIEEVIDERLPNVSLKRYASGFLSRFYESHLVMTQGNRGLKPRQGEVTSRPWMWPINLKGQGFSGGDHRVYLLGNPIIFWGNMLVTIIYTGFYLYHTVRKQRRRYDAYPYYDYKERQFSSFWWLISCWAIHYLPFWSMTRILYFHHYFPALMFHCMANAIALDYMLVNLTWVIPQRLRQTVYYTFYGLLIAGIGQSFYLFSPTVYGMNGDFATSPNSSMYGLKWLDTWEI
ncbi:protein O-mannosyl-transferase 2-like [Lineus longissimus]|uniref:protein O-mannosyl-transferase 2-like n=1 Tax=Lineus longissimus TaxID=88925 RepID=UPI00315C627A